MMRARLLILLTLAALATAAWSPVWAQAKPQRHLAVVLDTSTSMREAKNDQPRLAIQAIKILADLLGPADDLTVAWMPETEACGSPPDAGRRLDLKAGDLTGFKLALDDRATYGGPTNFIAPLLTAGHALEQSSAAQRLLIVISDAGRDACRADSVTALRALRAVGVHTASVSVGSKKHLVHNEYDTPTAAQTPAELLAAIGTIYQRFLGAKAPDSGALTPEANRIAAKVAPFVTEAFLLVAAEGPVGTISADPGNPTAEGVDLDHRSGETRGRDQVTRGYRIVRLRRPVAGTWQFSVAGLTGAAGWYLIQDFSVGLRTGTPPQVAQGQEVSLTVELIDHNTGQRIQRPGQIPGLALQALIEGTPFVFHDDGQNGDAAADDGLMSARVRFMKAGPATFPVQLVSQYMQVEQPQRTLVADGGTIRFGQPGTLELGRLTSQSVGETLLDLSFVKVEGRFDLRLRSDYSHSRSMLEIDLGKGFVPLGSGALDLSLQDGGNQRYPLRLRVGHCPAGIAADLANAGQVVLEATDQLGQPLQAAIPIRVEIIEDTWLHCWWPVIAAILLALLAVFILYGIVSPARFPRNLAVILSPEADMDEGYPFNIRSQKGARSGFYRNARMYISTDFQVRRSSHGALARLRADRRGVFILPLPGSTVLQLDEDNQWEPLSTTRETRVRFSTLYRNVSETLFFEFRNL